MCARESAIRLALGATPAALIRSIAGPVARLAAIGAAAALVLGAAVLAVALPAWRTARRDPLTALRQD
jgi:hypothetical protein